MKTKRNTFKLILCSMILLPIAILAQTPSYYWSMNNNTVQGSTSFVVKNWTLKQTGKFSGAYYTQRHEKANITQVSCIQSPNINLTQQGKYSFSAWINVAAYPKFHRNGIENYIFSKNNQFALLLAKNGEWQCKIWNTTTTTPDIITGPILPINRWVHLSLTVDGVAKVGKLYLNGVVVTTGSLSGLPFGASGDFIFGNTSPTGDFNTNFTGAYDEVKLYNDQVLNEDFIVSEASKNITSDHHWRFNEDTYSNLPIKDFMGYADLVTTPNITYASGKIGSSAIIFDNTDDGVYTNTDISLTQNGNYTIAFWINPSAYPAGEGVIFNKRKKANQIGGYLLPDGRFRSNIWGTHNEILVLNSNSSLPKNTWTHVAITIDNKNKTARLFINENLQITNPFSFVPNSINDAFEMGNGIFRGMIDDFRIYKNKVLAATDIHNLYTQSELKGVVNTPIRIDNFGQTPQRQFDYEPQFIAEGEVTFDADNRPYMRYDKYVQTLDDKGHWVRYDFSQAVKSAYRDWDGVADLKATQETRVVFDAQDWAYTIVQTAYRTQTPALKTTDLLLYSIDHCKTWKIMNLGRPTGNANWEIISTNDPVVKPPVLLTTTDKEVYAHFFKKNGTTLIIEKLLKVADNAGLQVNHSGHGKGVISSGDNLVHVCYYGSVADPSGDIGTPMYVKTINRNDFTMTPAFYLGSIGTSIDGHNFPVMEIDSRKVLHICYAGHHTKMVYRYSLTPNATASWSVPIDVVDPKTSNPGWGNTYSSLIIDKNDKLHYTSRYSGIRYAFTVSYMTKLAGGTWQENEQLLYPRQSNYHVWFQKLALDRKGNLYLNYSFSNQQAVQYVAFRNYQTEWAEANLKGFVTINGVDTYITEQNENLLYPNESINSTHPNVYAGLLTLRSRETQWRLATTTDFATSITTATLNNNETELIKNTITLYPNPTNNDITITGISRGDKITVFDMLGKEIFYAMAKQEQEVINTSLLKSGIYIVAIASKGQLKLVKE